MNNYRILTYIYDPNLKIEFKEGQEVKGFDVTKKVLDDLDYVDVFVPSKNTYLKLIKGVHLIPFNKNYENSLSDVFSKDENRLNNASSIDIIPDKGNNSQLTQDNGNLGVLKPAKVKIKPKDFVKKSVKEKSPNYLLAMIAGGALGYASRKTVFKAGKNSIFIISGAILGAFVLGVYSYNKETKK